MNRPETAETLTGEALVERVLTLARSLQARGVDIALSETLDAHRAVAEIGLASRPLLRAALRTTLVKQARHIEAFDAVFDRVFPQRVSAAAGRLAESQSAASMAERLAAGDDLALMAGELVDSHGGLDGELRGERHHLHRVCRAADLARMMSEARKVDPDVGSEELRRRIDELKRLIAADLRSQLGDPEIETLDGDLLDVDFLSAGRAQLDGIRDAVRPLARRLAGRLARRRRAQAGRVNLRRTARKSISTGGVPLEVAADQRRKRRPELFVLCDISGSVADVSLFTLTLMSALSAELARTRSFVFIDAIDEITELLAATEHGIGPWQIMRNTNVIGDDGHSDYGTVFRRFWDEVGERGLRPASTVLITGDARNNHRPAEAAMLGRIAGRCRHVYWLNPEPRREWGTDDSEMAGYARHCTECFEVRNLRQLSDCVEQIL